MADHLETPTTVKEIGIHLVYMSKELKELKDALNAQHALNATKEELSELEKRVVRIETRNNFKATLMWVGLVASLLINLFALFQQLTGA